MTNWTDIATAIVKLTDAGIAPSEISGLLGVLGQLQPISYSAGEVTEFEPESTHKGWQIVVLQRGWVVVGDVTRTWDELEIANASVIRKWGTTKGLGELVDGPLADTKLDAAGTIRANVLGVVLAIDVKAEKWSA